MGFRVELEANTDSGDQIDKSFMFVESTFGRLELGSINNVQYRMGYNAPEAQTRAWSNEGNITNMFANPTGTPFGDTMLGTTRSRMWDNDSEKINYYTPRFVGFQLGASYIPNSSQDRNGAPDPISTAYSRGWAAAANFVRTFGAFDIAASVGYMQWQGPQLSATTSAPDPDQWNIGLQVGFAGFKIGGSYGEMTDGRLGASGTNAARRRLVRRNKADGRAYDVGVMYTFGPAAVSLNYISGENDDCPVTRFRDVLGRRRVQHAVAGWQVHAGARRQPRGRPVDCQVRGQHRGRQHRRQRRYRRHRRHRPGVLGSQVSTLERGGFGRLFF